VKERLMDAIAAMDSLSYAALVVLTLAFGVITGLSGRLFDPHSRSRR